MVGDVHDVIMRAKFHVEILMGYDFTGGRISHFPIDFCMGLTTVQRKGTACDSTVILMYDHYAIVQFRYTHCLLIVKTVHLKS